MARFRPQAQDIASYSRRAMRTSLRGAVMWLSVAIVGAVAYRERDPLYSSACAGFAIAVVLVMLSAVNRWRRAMRRYGAEYREPIEYAFSDEGIRTTSEFGTSSHKRSAVRTVTRSHEAFEIYLRSSSQPLVIPLRHLAEDEIALLRTWQSGGDRPGAPPYRKAGG